MALHRLTRIVVGVPDVGAATSFYRDFGLAHLGSGRFATADGGEQLQLTRHRNRGLIELGIGCDDAGDLAEISAALARAGLEYQRDQGSVTVTDRGSGARARVTIAARYRQQPRAAAAANGPGADARVNQGAPGAVREGGVRPRRLGHVVVGSTDVEASERLFIGILGFQVSDAIRGAGKFIRCSTDHHNLMVSPAPAQYLHHTSWQVDDVDEVGRGAASMLAADPSRHAWGLGRHKVGGNFFWYLRDPAGNYAEYYSDLDIITEQLRWDAHEWSASQALYAWGPPSPRGFFRPGDLAELMMKGNDR